MNTVNSFQYHRLRRRGTLGYNDDEDRDRHVTTAFYLKRRTGSSEKPYREKEATDYSKSEAELVGGGRHGETCHL